MTSVPEPLASRLALPATTLCHAWRLTLADGARFGFTDHDQILTIDGLPYEPHSGMTASEARDSAGMAVDKAELSGALASDRLSEAEIVAGRFDGATVETLLVDWTTPGAHVVLRSATIGKLTRSDGAFVAEIDSLAQGYDQPRGRHYRRGCDAEIGDARCGVDLATPAWRADGQISAVLAGGGLRVSGLDAFADGWFAGGSLIGTGGSKRLVSGHFGRVDGVVLTLGGDGAPIPVGAPITVAAGCDKSFATCKAKFANSLNFRGFPHLPGNDAVYAYATEDAVFDGAPLVP